MSKKLRITKVYTRKGDGGNTALVGGREVSKASPRVEAYGGVDELNCILGVALAWGKKEHEKKAWWPKVSGLLFHLQHELFHLGAELATLPEDFFPGQPKVGEEETKRLETLMDDMNQELPPLANFLLPGGGVLGAQLHMARVVCRRVERGLVVLQQEAGFSSLALPYLNRLSDFFFVLARWVALHSQEKETLWNQG